MGVSENEGYLILGPFYKDPTIQGSILRSPIFGNSHIEVNGWPETLNRALFTFWDTELLWRIKGLS